MLALFNLFSYSVFSDSFHHIYFLMTLIGFMRTKTISAGVVEEMVCCEIDGYRAYCEMSEASCSNNQIMGGILQKGGELQNNCCYLTDKITGKY